MPEKVYLNFSLPRLPASTGLSRGGYRGSAKSIGLQGRQGWPPGIPQPVSKQGEEKPPEFGTYGERNWGGCKAPWRSPFCPPRWGGLYGRSFQAMPWGFPQGGSIQRISNFTEC